MKKVILVIILIIAVFLGWQLARPLFVDDTVDEQLPEEFNEFALPTSEEFRDMSPEEKEKAEMKMIEMFAGKETIVAEEMPDGPALVSSGNFTDADGFHKGSGLAKLFKSDSDSLLRFEEFMVTNGPDLHVILATNPNPTDHDSLGEYIDLGKLKGNIGNQNYSIPSDVDVSKYKSVVIYCDPFSVVFSTASLN